RYRCQRQASPMMVARSDRTADQPSNSRARVGSGTRDDRIARAAQCIACVGLAVVTACDRSTASPTDSPWTPGVAAPMRRTAIVEMDVTADLRLGLSWSLRYTSS